MNSGKRNPQAGTLLRFFDVMSKEIGELKLDYALVFLKVTDKPGATQRLLAEELDMPYTTLNRMVNRLSDSYYDQHARMRKEGPNLLLKQQDDRYPKQELVFLSLKGEALVDRLLGAIDA